MISDGFSLFLSGFLVVAFLVLGLLDLADHFIAKTFLISTLGILLLNFIIIWIKRISQNQKNPEDEPQGSH